LGISAVRRHVGFDLQVLQRHFAAHYLSHTSLWLKENAEMTLQIGDLAPDFTAESATGELRFHEWLGESWGILFSHPADFTPACTTELGAAARLEPEFARRDTKIAAVSVDSAKDHHTWAKDIAETQGAQVNLLRRQ
jgi:peroxiredoxin